MRKHLVEAATFAGLGTIPFVVVLLLLPGSRALAADAYFLFLGAILLLGLARATRDEAGWRKGSQFERAVQARAPNSERVGQLERLEREVVLARGRAFDVHHRLRPVLREIAAHRLGARRAVVMDEEPERARALLGDETWELLRPERPPPEARLAEGFPVDRLERIVDSLERL